MKNVPPRLLVLLLVAAGCGRPAAVTPEPEGPVVPPVKAPARDDPSAIAALAKLGVKLQRDEKRPERPVIRAVVTPGPGGPPTESPLGLLARLPHLREISLNNMQGLDDKGFAALAKLDGLTVLELNQTGVGDAVLADIGKLVKLERLLLRGSRASAAGLKHLAGLKELRVLDLGACAGVEDRSLAIVEGMPKLETLLLPNCARLADPGLASVARLTNLKTLSLAAIPVGDQGIRMLAGLKSLEQLDLADTKVSDVGLEALAGLPLASLDLTRTRAVGLPLGKMRKLLVVKLREAPVNDATLTALAQVPYLREIDLAFTNIGDSSLEKLKEKKTLRKLDLWKTKVTSTGLAFLEDLPRLEQVHVVVIDGGDPKECVTPEAVEKLKEANKGVRVDD